MTITAEAGPFVMITSGYSNGAALDVLELSYKARKQSIKHLKEENGVVERG
jgi:hypothetical protein